MYIQEDFHDSKLLITRIIGIHDYLHVTHYFIISLNGVVYLDGLLVAQYCIF